MASNNSSTARDGVDHGNVDHENNVVDLHQAALLRAQRRAEAHPPAAPAPAAQQQNDAEDPDDEDDDFRHRMTTNAVAIVAVLLLVIAGVWIADTMAMMRKNQDCVLSGRRNCTQVEAPPAQRW